jgi:hypothetical protein
MKEKQLYEILESFFRAEADECGRSAEDERQPFDTRQTFRVQQIVLIDMAEKASEFAKRL